MYLSFSPLPLVSLVFSAIYKASSDNHFAFLHFFFLGMVLIPVSCTMSQTSVHSSSSTLSDLVPLIYFSLPLIIIRVWFRSYLNGLVVLATACCGPWGRKESDTTEQLNWTELKSVTETQPNLPNQKEEKEKWQNSTGVSLVSGTVDWGRSQNIAISLFSA